MPFCHIRYAGKLRRDFVMCDAMHVRTMDAICLLYVKNFRCDKIVVSSLRLSITFEIIA